MRMCTTLGTVCLLAVVSWAGNAEQKEVPVKADGAAIDRQMAAAPAMPFKIEPALNLELVDYIDCTNPADPHDFKDQGTSRITEGPAGKYRVTAAHRHAFFAYRWRSAGQDKPHLVVFEYPDDATRMPCFFMDEADITGGKNHMWSLETGTWNDRPYPRTNKMQYHSLYFWPKDSWPALIVANWNRYEAPAGCSRVWIYLVKDGLKAPAMDIPDVDNQRMIGTFHNWSLVPMHGSFGRTSMANTAGNIADYYAGQGCNLLSWPVLASDKFSFKCIIPAWGVTENAFDKRAGSEKGVDELETILAACDNKGIRFVPTFEFGFNTPLNGVKVQKGSDKNRTAYRDTLKKGFKEFIDRYGKHPSLYGIAFDTPDLSPAYGQAVLDIVDQVFDGGMQEFVAYLHSLKPNLKVQTFIGYLKIHHEYFKGAGWEVISGWEKQGGDWSDYLADKVRKLWKEWERDPVKMNGIKGLEIIDQYQPDDHVIFDYYNQNPRAAAYFDVDDSRTKAKVWDSQDVMLFNTFFEGYFGLDTNNFWYKKLWVAPDFNPAPPYGMAAWARALAHRDRRFILAGSWNNKPAGQEELLKPWAAAFRSLPPVDMADVSVPDDIPVVVRQAVYKKHNYVSVLNNSPFPAEITLEFSPKGGKEKVMLAPFALKALKKKAKQQVVKVTAPASEAYIDWVKGRIEAYDALVAEVEKLDAAAVTPAFKAVSKKVNGLFNAKKVYQADYTLGIGLTAELNLRKKVLTPERKSLPKLSAAPPLQGDLSAWPEGAADVMVDKPGNIAAHLFMPNAWTGPDDFSARIRYGHDDKNIYVGVRVTDQTVHVKDDVTIQFSRTGYKDWRGNSIKYDINSRLQPSDTADVVTLADSTGFTGTLTRLPDGYVVEASVPLDSVFKDGADVCGFAVNFGDYDDPVNATSSGWARETVMVYPYRPSFAYYEDARTGMELKLEK